MLFQSPVEFFCNFSVTHYTQCSVVFQSTLPTPLRHGSDMVRFPKLPNRMQDRKIREGHFSQATPAPATYKYTATRSSLPRWLSWLTIRLWCDRSRDRIPAGRNNIQALITTNENFDDNLTGECSKLLNWSVACQQIKTNNKNQEVCGNETIHW